MLIDREDSSLIHLIDEGIMTVNQSYLQVSRLRQEDDARQEEKDQYKEVKTFGFIANPLLI